MELEKSSSSAVTGKRLPASMQLQTSTPNSDNTDKSLVAALEKAKEKVQEMVKKRHQELENPDSEPLYPTFKKSRVVPKSSTGVLTENVSVRRLEDDNMGTDIDSKKKSSAANLDESSHSVGTNAEGVASASESQKNETNKTKKSLPFIGKLPFLKAARTAKQTAVDQSAADDKSKIEIKLNVSTALSTTVDSEPATLSSDTLSTSAQEQAVPDWSASVPSSNVENSSMDKQNSLDAFLSIGDPESGQSRTVPVLSVGPQTHSEFMLENQPKKTSPKTAEANNTLLHASKNAELVDSSANDERAAVCNTDDADVASVPSSSVDVKAANADEVMENVQLDAAVPTSSAAETSQTGDLSVSITGTSTAHTTDAQILSHHDDDAATASDTNRTTDLREDVEDHNNTSAMSLEVDDNTEDYEPQNDAKTEKVAQVPRDEETAQLLPQISAAWMQPAASGYFALLSYILYFFNPFNVSCSKLLLFKGLSTILV